MYFPLFFADSAHAKHIFTTSYVFVMVKKGAHTHKKKPSYFTRQKENFVKIHGTKKINLKKEKSRPSEKCFIPFQWSEASKKKRTQKILLLLSSENLKKNPYIKMEYYDEQNINCAWRDTLYLLHSWSFWFEDSIIIHATKCFWSHEISRGLFKNRSFATSSKP